MPMAGKPPPCMSKTRRVYPATAVPGRMRKTLLPLTPLPSVNSTGAGGDGGLALGVAVSRGLALAEGCRDAVAVGEVELKLCRPFASHPPSYSTAARSTHAAAPRPTASRIAVSGLRGSVAGALSSSNRSAGSCSNTTLPPVAAGIGSPGGSVVDSGGGCHISSSRAISRSGTLVTSGRIGVGSSASGGVGAVASGGAISNDREPASARNRSGIAAAKAWSMAAAPTDALGRRPTRSNISRKSSTRSRQASHRRRWSRAHSRSFPSSRSSSTALGEMRGQRVPSELDVVIDLPEFGTTAVQGIHQLAWGDIDHVAELLVREFYEVTQQDHGARLEGERRQRPLHGVAA